MADRVGQQLGNYQLIRLLGEGGFAEVYLGEHIHLGTQAAIKVLHTQLTSDDVDRFRTEARTIARLIHSHIVRVLEFGVEGKTPFLVMDYAPNGTLRQRHPKGVALPLPLIVAYVKQVADALQYAHDEKLIHRDIKPENMLLGRHNDILLSDFGIALVAQSSRYQSAQEMAGTMAYMAPEQIQGKPRPASDQYSLGVVVYEWISGDRPFHGSLTELVGQHLSVPPPSLQEKVSTISPEMDQVVLTALAKDPKQRFASVQVFATILEQAYQSSQHYPPAPSVVASPPSQSPLPNVIAPSLNQSSLPTNAVEAILPNPAPLLTNTVISLSHSPQSTTVVIPPSQSPQATNVVTPSASLSQPTVAATPTHTPAVSPPLTEEPTRSGEPQRLLPSQRRISRRVVMIGLLAGLTGVSVVGGGLIWLTRSQRPVASFPSFRPTLAPSPTPSPFPTPSPSPTSTPVPVGTLLYTYRGHANAQLGVFAVAWSPKGKRVASGSWDATVQVWDAVDGGHVFTYRGHSQLVAAVAWSPDGTRIVSGSGDSTVQVWDAVDGRHAFTYRGHSGNVTTVIWSRDGTRIVSGSNDSTVQVWDAVDGGHAFTYRGHSQLVAAVARSPDGTRIASASQDTTVQVWDVVDGGHAFTYRGHAGANVNAVAWSPNGKRIASGGGDKTVQVWDAVDGGHAFTYRGHAGAVWAIAWSPDGKRIASTDEIGTVQVWDAVDGGHVFTYRGHASAVWAIAWSPDGTTIASAGADKTVQVWQAS